MDKIIMTANSIVMSGLQDTVVTVPKDHLNFGDIKALVIEHLSTNKDIDDEVRELLNIRPAILRVVSGVSMALPADFIGPDGLDIDFDGNVMCNGAKVDSYLADAIFKAAANSKNPTALMNFAKRVQANPDPKAREDLFKFLQHLGMPITQHGTFIAYKGVYSTEQEHVYAACHDRTFLYELGEMSEKERNSCDPNWRAACSSGLHVGTYEHAKTYGNSLLEVEVDPADAVAVPHAENFKLRACKVFPLRICEGKHVGIYTSDTGSGKLGSAIVAPSDSELWKDLSREDEEYEDEEDDDDEEEEDDDDDGYVDSVVTAVPTEQQTKLALVDTLSAVAEKKAAEPKTPKPPAKPAKAKPAKAKSAGGGRNPKTTWYRVANGKLLRDRKVASPGPEWSDTKPAGY